jgi:hypothetical protein
MTDTSTRSPFDARAEGSRHPDPRKSRETLPRTPNRFAAIGPRLEVTLDGAPPASAILRDAVPR